MNSNSKSIEYKPDLFDLYLKENDLDLWEGFPELMQGLGFAMDCEHSFSDYRDSCGLKLVKAHTRREEFRNNLFLLEHADRQIVGNYLFSHWRYYTHWAYEYDAYDVDYLRRIISILKSKYAGKEHNENGSVNIQIS